MSSFKPNQNGFLFFGRKRERERRVKKKKKGSPEGVMRERIL